MPSQKYKNAIIFVSTISPERRELIERNAFQFYAYLSVTLQLLSVIYQELL